ncbi:hypothetical protein FIBSPDRAFT_976426 [Athelia psychrophila]|uniref:Uncharacterized protein n=1 Tax=Athelia psychrophila TaxID=1759441 RepID=A0A166EXJ1_9AGAM|nr:hypothetical protein FIBSPDRAFT_976426 [Fibularhizoctonia sp. CBS 109695]
MAKNDPNDDLSHVDVDPPSSYANYYPQDLARLGPLQVPTLVVSDVSCPPTINPTPCKDMAEKTRACSPLLQGPRPSAHGLKEVAPILSGPQRDHVVFPPPSIPPQARPHIPVLPDWYFEVHFPPGHTCTL